MHELLVIIHTYDVLAAIIKSFHQSFGLFGKVSATVTDNESNFVEAFASFAVPDVSSVSESSDSVEDDNELEEEEVTFIDVVEVMVPDDLTRDVQLTLSTRLPVMMLTNSFHCLHYQEAYTEVLLANERPFGIRPAPQLLLQISYKKY